MRDLNAVVEEEVGEDNGKKRAMNREFQKTSWEKKR